MKGNISGNSIDDTNSYRKLTIVSTNDSKTLNKKIRLIIIAMLLAFFAIALIVFASFEIPMMLHEYSIQTNEPNIVYMGEAITLNVENKIDDQNFKMASIIESTNDLVLYTLNKKGIGSKIETTIVPGQEGVGNIEIYSSYIKSKDIKKYALAKEKVSITVCPAFNLDLLTSSNISIIKGIKHPINIDFGEDECKSDIIYKSSNERIATVDTDGNITGINPGRTELIISKMGKKLSVPVVVTSKRINVNDIVVNYPKLQLMPGDSFRLNAKQVPNNSTSININYTSRNTEIATVSNSGLIKALKPGTTIINVSYGKIKKEVLVIVNDVGLKQSEATNIEVDKENVVLKKGTSHKIITRVTPDSAINRLNKWDSSNYKVAVVDYNGVVYANEVGTADITVKNGSISKTIKVIVTQ